MSGRMLLGGQTLIQKQIKEIIQNHKQCMNLLKARYRTILYLSAAFSLLEANKTIVEVCFHYRSLTHDDIKKLQDWWVFTVLKIVFYIGAQLPAGRLSELRGSKWILFASVAGSGLCLLLMPVVILHMGSMIGLQVLFYANYLFLGFALPATQAMLARWAIPSERILVSSIVYSSFPLGKAVGLTMSIWICSSFGWPVTFYVFGGLSAILLVFWTIFVHDDYGSPRARITKHEKEAMARDMAGEVYNYKDMKFSRLPLLPMLKCRPLWAVLVAQLTIVFCQAKYVTPVHKNLDEMKRGSALGMGPINQAVIMVQPYFLAVMLTWILGLVFFNLVTGHIMTKRGVYQAGCVFSIVGITVTVILKIVIQEGEDFHMLSDQMAMGSLTGLASTAFAPYLDMAPNYAGTIMAIHNVLITIPELLVFDMFEREAVVNNVGHGLLVTAVLLSLFFYQFYVTDELMKWNNYSLPKRRSSTSSVRINVDHL